MVGIWVSGDVMGWDGVEDGRGRKEGRGRVLRK